MRVKVKMQDAIIDLRDRIIIVRIDQTANLNGYLLQASQSNLGVQILQKIV